MSKTQSGVPTFDKLLNPTLEALRKLGGSASVQELVDQVLTDLRLPASVTEIPHGRGNMTEVEYRSAWARNYLKNAGLIENSERGIWAVTPNGAAVGSIDARELVRAVQRLHREQREKREAGEAKAQDHGEHEESVGLDWRTQLLETLLAVPPSAFERLCQRLLREAGFIEVEVTGRSGDGGIDGHGTIRIGGLISFNVLFQCKRYRGNIGPDIVRDFRGAMIGRADKGLIITTGGFTRDARKEATRDGAPPIDLIDGELLVEKLKELRLGVNVKMVESVEIREEWFVTL